MYYVISVTGYETYQPHWFSCNCSKTKFNEIVKQSIDEAMGKIGASEYDSYIDGHSLLEFVIPILEEKGFKEIKIDHEIEIGGECLYRNNKTDIPTDHRWIFSSNVWRKILKHNKKIDKRD